MSLNWWDIDWPLLKVTANTSFKLLLRSLTFFNFNFTNLMIVFEILIVDFISGQPMVNMVAGSGI